MNCLTVCTQIFDPRTFVIHYQCLLNPYWYSLYLSLLLLPVRKEVLGHIFTIIYSRPSVLPHPSREPSSADPPGRLTYFIISFHAPVVDFICPGSFDIQVCNQLETTNDVDLFIYEYLPSLETRVCIEL